MWRTILILLVLGFAACASDPDPLMEPDPFGDAEPVAGGQYVDLPMETAPTATNGFVRFLNDEWKSSVTGWSFTGRSIGRWAQRDWNRLFGESD